MSSLGSTRSRLAALTRELNVRWHETRLSWNDAKRDEFERTHLAPLLEAVDKAGTALEQLDEIVLKARKECE